MLGRAVLATMHGKEAAIAPVLLERLGLAVSTAPDLDSDALGTFTGEIPALVACTTRLLPRLGWGLDQTIVKIG